MGRHMSYRVLLFLNRRRLPSSRDKSVCTLRRVEGTPPLTPVGRPEATDRSGQVFGEVVTTEGRKGGRGRYLNLDFCGRVLGE